MAVTLAWADMAALRVEPTLSEETKRQRADRDRALAQKLSVLVQKPVNPLRSAPQTALAKRHPSVPEEVRAKALEVAAEGEITVDRTYAKALIEDSPDLKWPRPRSRRSGDRLADKFKPKPIQPDDIEPRMAAFERKVIKLHRECKDESVSYVRSVEDDHQFALATRGKLARDVVIPEYIDDDDSWALLLKDIKHADESRASQQIAASKRA
jgi:hypothetical protein